MHETLICCRVYIELHMCIFGLKCMGAKCALAQSARVCFSLNKLHAYTFGFKMHKYKVCMNPTRAFCLHDAQPCFLIYG